LFGLTLSPRWITVKVVLAARATATGAGDHDGISFLPSDALIVAKHLPTKPRLQIIDNRPGNESDDQIYAASRAPRKLRKLAQRTPSFKD
jgi:hypothetical protein